MKQIAEIYLFLAKANKAEAASLSLPRIVVERSSSHLSPQVVRVVGKDERYYSDFPAQKGINFCLFGTILQLRQKHLQQSHQLCQALVP